MDIKGKAFSRLSVTAVDSNAHVKKSSSSVIIDSNIISGNLHVNKNSGTLQVLGNTIGSDLQLKGDGGSLTKVDGNTKW